MALEDLDLEFEDEEEAKKKKSDAVQVDVDLEFQAPVGGGKPRPVVRPVSPDAPAADGARPQPKSGGGEVRQLDEARAVTPNRVPGERPGHRPAASGGAQASAKLNSLPDLDNSAEVVELRQQVQKVEFEASVKVAIAEFKVELLSELNSDVKLMDHQVGQLLSRINAKHPDLKQEVLMIKKILADFTAKKRK